VTAPPAAPSATDQITAVFTAPVTWAVKVAPPPGASATVDGDTVTATDCAEEDRGLTVAASQEAVNASSAARW
jgi:hypothetical protein